MFKTDVFERYGSDTISRNAFYLIMSLTIVWGLGVTGYVASLMSNWEPTLLGFIGLCIIPFVGIFLARTGNPVISFIAYHLIVVPFGVMLGPVLAMAEVKQPGIVSHAAYLTAVVSGVMGVSGTVFPGFYSRIGTALLWSLVALLVVRIAQIFIPALDFTLIDYIAAGIFSLYIGYDMHRANTIGATPDNAIDVAIALYLDILNLFLTLLRILKE